MFKLKFVWFYHKESLESWSMWLCVNLERFQSGSVLLFNEQMNSVFSEILYETSFTYY